MGILKIIFFYLFVISGYCTPILAQSNSIDAADAAYFDSVAICPKKGCGYEPIKIKKFILPVALFTSGLALYKIKVLNGIDNKVYNNKWDYRKYSLDDYLQYAPAALAFGLGAVGIKGRCHTQDKIFISALAGALSFTSVEAMKRIYKRQRPDMSETNAFPSGHTATAFMSAEFLNREYGKVSPWYSVAGYSLATATAVLRVYKQRHWCSDVIAGAGIGILSTRLAYLLYPKIKTLLVGHKNACAFIPTPYYDGLSGGIKIFCINAR